MKSYLSLIPISAKVHKRQNLLTLLCIVFSVFLVTSVFSMAEMGIRMETIRLLGKHGSQTFEELIKNETVQMLCIASAMLFVFILIAGVLMIASSINSNVAQRTKSFGMMRCIGMSKKQIIRFVILEALNWCKTAIPIGIILGIITTWGMCAALRFIVENEFSDIPQFGISVIGIISGVVIGIVTVLIAAKSPARRAAKVSPVTAVTGNLETTKRVKRSISLRFFKVETALGKHHATTERKNLILMTGSFALSIILFLCFSVLISFVGYLMPQLSDTPDISISSMDGLNSIDYELLNTIGNMEGVKCAFGRRSCFNVSAKLNDNDLPLDIDIISFDDFDLDCIKKDRLLIRGSNMSKVYGNSKYVLAAWDKNSSWEIGDKIQIGNEEFEIAGLLKYDPFSSDGLTNGKITLIVSCDTFTHITGETDYSLLMLQTKPNITDDDIEAIKNCLDMNCQFRDLREQRTTSTYIAFVFFVYGFLVIIALVTVLNIINSISMSVSARMKQYGAMRAVGMDGKQIMKMIAAEAFTYAVFGCVSGCAVGLFLNKKLYDILIAAHFGYAIWSIPFIPLTIIFLFVLGAAIVAVWLPSKRIQNISIIETINEL